MRRWNTFIQYASEQRLAAVTKIATELNRADILTKILSYKVYARMRDLIAERAGISRKCSSIRPMASHVRCLQFGLSNDVEPGGVLQPLCADPCT